MRTIRKTFSLTPAALLAALAGTALGQSTTPFPAQFELSSLLPINGGDGSEGFVLTGIDINNMSGRSVSSAGDVNGDGIDDLIIGAPGANPNGIFNAGESYVVFGSAGLGSVGVMDLSSLDGINGFVLNGINASDYSGRNVSSAGDVNGDGFDDLIISAYHADPNSSNSAGENYVVFGGATVGVGGAINLSSLNGVNGFVLNGIDAYDFSGRSVSSTGDVNGDGFDDLIIGATSGSPNAKVNAGESYVIFGGATVGAGGVIELSTLNGANGFVLNGIDIGDQSGRSVSSAGDVNGDGIDDLIIGAYLADPNSINGAGESYVVFGAAGLGSAGVIELSSLNGTNGFVLNGIDIGDRSRNVSSAGDVNGDGIGDLIIGADYADPTATTDAGESYVVFGSATVGVGGTINLSSLNGANGFVLNGIDANDRSGSSVSAAGDVNSDGIDDLIIGAFHATPSANSQAGESYVIFGGAGVGAAGVIELSMLNGTNGFVLKGIDANDYSGLSVSSAGDVNGDGISDLIIGAYAGDPNGISNAGESYVVFGRNMPPKRIQSFGVPGEASAVAAADLGSEPIGGSFGGPPDTLIDMIVTIPDSANANTAAGAATILYNKGNSASGSWLGYGEQVSLAVGIDPSGIAIVALDDDKWDDLLVTNRADGTVTALLNDGQSFVTNPLSFSFSVGAAPSSIVAGNLGMSLRADIAVANEGDNSVSIMTNGGGIGAAWTGLTQVSTLPVGSNPVSIALFNADDDKWDDLVTANFVSNNLSFLRNNGFASFAPQFLIAVGAGPRQVIAVDIDGDGDVDLATANETGNSVSIIENLTPLGGPVNLTKIPSDILVDGGPGSIAAFDVDLDGDFDLVVVADDGSGTLNVLKLLRNDTSQVTGVIAFTPDGTLPGGPDPRFVLGADVNQSFGSELVMSNSGALVTVVDQVTSICAGDADFSLLVSFQDITSVLANWQMVYPPSTTGLGDANGDGIVNFADITTVLGNWLSVCP